MYFFNRKGEKIDRSDNLNQSGMLPVEDKVLLLPDLVAEKSGMIHKPETVLAQEQLAQVKALLVAVGGNAFEDWGEPIPEIGMRVMVCKYAGILDILGADEESYQLCTDRDITAIIVEDAPSEFLGTRKALGQPGYEGDLLEVAKK